VLPPAACIAAERRPRLAGGQQRTSFGPMNQFRLYAWLLGGAAAGAAAGAVSWARSHRKTPEQREYERRQFLKETGRITDGTVIDVHEAGGAPPGQLLIYKYHVGGVSYQCAQDVAHLRQPFDIDACRIGLPASVKYDPHNPGNSIVVAEGWIGLRL